MAVVLGTALSAFGSGAAQAAPAEVSAGAIRDVSRYCTACWRNARLPVDCWCDCTQEVFGRLVQTIDPASWDQVFASEGAERQEFLRARLSNYEVRIAELAREVIESRSRADTFGPDAEPRGDK